MDRNLGLLGSRYYFFQACTSVSDSYVLLQLYGEDFIHGGRPSYTKYVEPAELLSEPTVDERIPFK